MEQKTESSNTHTHTHIFGEVIYNKCAEVIKLEGKISSTSGAEKSIKEKSSLRRTSRSPYIIP